MALSIIKRFRELLRAVLQIQILSVTISALYLQQKNNWDFNNVQIMQTHIQKPVHKYNLDHITCIITSQ